MVDSTTTTNSIKLLSTPKEYYKQQITEIVQGTSSYVDFKTLADEHERLKAEAINMLDKTRRLIGLLFWKKYRKHLEVELEAEYEHVKEVNRIKQQEFKRREEVEKLNQIEQQRLKQLEEELCLVRTNYTAEIQKLRQTDSEHHQQILSQIEKNAEVIPLVSNYIMQSKLSKLSKGLLACTVGAPIDGLTGFTKSAATSVLKLIKTLD